MCFALTCGPKTDIGLYDTGIDCSVFFSESQNVPLQRAVAGLNMCLNGSCNFIS